MPELARMSRPLITACFLLIATVGLCQSKTTPPKPVRTVTAEYPDSAIREGIDATVSVGLTIPPDGIPKDVKVTKGFRPDFDESAVNAIRQWRFRPAMKDGKPIEVTVTIEVAFKRPR